MRIIIAGSRDFKDYEMLREKTLDILSRLQYDYVVGRKDIEVICGMASGADLLGKRFAEEFGLKVVPFPAKWDDLSTPPVFVKFKSNGEAYNVMAGFARNKKMAEYAAQDEHGILIAFSMGSSKGTQDTIKQGKKNNLEVYVVNGHNGEIVKASI